MNSGAWSASLSGTALLANDYADRNALTLRLYHLGKQRQWDADERLDWQAEGNPDNPLGMPDSVVWIAGTPLWDRLPEAERIVLRRHTAAWNTSQLLHGEQLGLIAVAKVAQTVPDVDSKLFAATQVMDEARHCEVFDRFLRTKIGLQYPVAGSLSTIFGDIVRDGRWDMSALGVQVLIENIAMAAFTLQRDQSADPLTQALTTYIMQDEARHVAFGRILLRKHYRDLTAAERREREEFVVEASWALRDGFIGEDIWNTLDYGAAECIALARSSPALRQYRRRLFMRIVPALKDIGLFGPPVREALAKMGVLGFAELHDDAVENLDDRVLAEIDSRERAARQEEIEAMIALGAVTP